MPRSALAFLRLVLPDEGLKCAVIFQNGPKRPPIHKFTPSFEELAQIVLSADALGHTVYHACASYKTPDSRKASNVLCAKAFWLDVDAGEGKPYGDAEEAARAVLSFARTMALPAPVLVASGSGVHAYWPLVQTLGSKDWTDRATAFKRLCDANNLRADGVRTADLASILRCPGTRNRKGDTETIVRWGGPVGPYRLEELGALNGGISLPGVPVRRSVDALPNVRFDAVVRTDAAIHPTSRRSLIDAALTLYGEQPAYAETVAGTCAQVGELRDRSGRVAEPHWYAALGVLAHCADGESFAHHWSSGYAGYTHEETQSRIERARTFGPTTCEKFQGVNAEGCQGCPVKGRITSPVQLGRGERPLPQVDTSNRQRRLNAEPPILDESLGELRLPKLPDVFCWQKRTLGFVGEDNDGEESCDVVSTYPLYLKGVQTGEINGEAFSLRFGLELPNEPPGEIVLGARTIFSANGISEISGRGAVIHDTDLFKRYVRDAVDMWNADNRLDKRFEQYGWKDDGSFLFGPHLYIRGEAQPIAGADEVKIRNQWLGPCKGGDLGKWSRAANALFTKGCEPQSFALLGSFAAPLMRFHSTGEGGSIISLVNDQSGSGKTTALEAVESVWGRKEAIRLTDDDTRVSKSLILGVLANLPVTWDELYNRDPEVIRQFVLMFTNGRDRNRGTQEGQLRHNKAQWQTILTLASNNSIVDILSTGDGSDAPAFRVLEFQTEIPKGVARKGDDLKRELRDNSGFAGDVYMRLLTQPQVLDFIKQALPKWTEQIWAKTQLQNEHRFWVRTIASVMAASVLVNKLGILEFSADRITDWAIEYVRGDLSKHEAARRDPTAVFSDFLAENLANTLVVATQWKPRTEQRPLVEPRKELQIRYEKDSARLYINEAFLRRWLVDKNIPITPFLRALQDMHVILREGKRVTLGAGTDYASGQAICYEFDGAHPAVKGGIREIKKVVPPDPRGPYKERYRQLLDKT